MKLPGLLYKRMVTFKHIYGKFFLNYASINIGRCDIGRKLYDAILFQRLWGD